MDELEKFYAEHDSLNKEAARLTQKREELDKRLKQFLTKKLEANGDGDVILEERNRAPYIRNVNYGGKVYGFIIY